MADSDFTQQIQLPPIVSAEERMELLLKEFEKMTKIHQEMRSELTMQRANTEALAQENELLRTQLTNVKIENERRELQATQQFKSDLFLGIKPTTVVANNPVNVPRQPEGTKSLMAQLADIKMPKIAVHIDSFPPKPDLDQNGTRKPFTETELRDKFNTWYSHFKLMTSGLSDPEKLYVLLAKIVEPLREWFMTQVRSRVDVTYDILCIQLEE